MSNPDPNPDAVPGEAPTTPAAPAGSAYNAAPPPEPETLLDYDTTPVATFPAPPDEPPPPAPAPRPTDKLWVHFVWEGLLLVLVALGIAAFLLFGPSGGIGSPTQVVSLLVGSTPFLLIAMALGLSMRAGSVNLAVVHLALLSMVLFSVLDHEPFLVAAGIVAGAMAAAGMVLALLVTVFKAPGWAASLLIAMAVWFLVTQREFGLLLLPSADMAYLTDLDFSGLMGWIIIAAVVALSIAGGLIGLMRPVRETFGVCVDAVERRGRRTPAAFLTTWGVLIGSCLLAGAAGYLAMLPTGANLTIRMMTADGLAPLLTGLGVALIGGTAARGRRGGVFGTLLAAVAVFMVAAQVDMQSTGWIINNAIPFGALLLGLLVNWIMDVVNRPRRTRPANQAMYAPEPAPATPMFVRADPPPPAAAQTLVVPADLPPPADPAPEPPVAPQSGSDGSTQEIPADANPYLYRPPAG